jgi:hypothetical protein
LRVLSSAQRTKALVKLSHAAKKKSLLWVWDCMSPVSRTLVGKRKSKRSRSTVFASLGVSKCVVTSASSGPPPIVSSSNSTCPKQNLAFSPPQN